MKVKLLSRLIRMLCLSGAALSMSSAIAEETSVNVQLLEMVSGGRLIEALVASDDPEGEVSNGSDPPVAANNLPEGEVGNGIDTPMDIFNFPEGEVTNGMDPPI